jgi:hypothetical protein
MLFSLLSLLLLMFSPLISLAESPFPSAKSLTADEAIWLEKELANCCKIEQWSLREGPLDLVSWTHKLRTPNGSHLLFIEEIPGAHTQWFKVLHHSGDGYIKELSFAEPVYLGDPEKLVGIGIKRSVYNPSYDPDTGIMTTWDFARAGDLSWKTYYVFDGEYRNEFLLNRYQADTSVDDQMRHNLDISFVD